MMSYKQPPPFCIQVELTTGCNLHCSFCGILGFQEKPNSNFKFMSIETAETLAKQIAATGWNSRIELAMHGEPTMNPNWIEIVGIFRKHFKNQILLTTNGGGILKGGDVTETINRYFEAGGTILAIDAYEYTNLGRKIREQLEPLDLICNNVYEYPEEKAGNPHQRSKKTFLSFVKDISVATNGTHAHLENHAGSAGPLDYSRTDKPCVKPFREMGVNSNGSIDICCNDWLGEMPVGNIHEMTISEIWHSDEFYAMRRMLMGRDRVYRPCLGCSDMGYRVGLLPDNNGRVELDPMDDFDREIIEEALANGPTRKPVGKVAQRLKDIIIVTEEL